MSARTKLRDLRIADLTAEDVEAFRSEIATTRNDRGVAILAATLLEQALSTAITYKLPGLIKQKSRIFDASGPLSTFDSRIAFAAGLEIISNEIRDDIDLIKHIRNTFAHTGKPISFDTIEIKEACASIRNGGSGTLKPRDTYILCCMSYASRLFEWGQNCKYMKAGDVKPDTMFHRAPPTLT